MTGEEKIICKQFLNDADKTHSCNEYKLLMNLIDQETVSKDSYDHEYFLRRKMETQIDHLNKYISKLETQIVEQEPRWISVSEELPKKTGWYLITFKVYGGDYAVCEMCYRKPENYWVGKDISKKIFDNDEVIAWMPKPKPYRAESEEK